MAGEERDQLMSILANQVDAVVKQQQTMAERMDVVQGFHTDTALAVSQVTQLTNRLLGYEQTISELNKEIALLREDVRTLKDAPNPLTGLTRVLIPALSILIAMILASFGLNLTTLIFVLNHVVGK